MMEGAVSGGTGPSCLKSLSIAPMCRSVHLEHALTKLAGITSKQQCVGADHSVQQHYKLWLAGFMGSSHGNACQPLASPCVDRIITQVCTCLTTAGVSAGSWIP